MKERTRNMVVRVDDDELRMAHEIAEAHDVPISWLVRRWIRDAHTKMTATKEKERTR